MATIEQSTVLDPPTSVEVIARIRAANDDGSRVILLLVEGQPLHITFQVNAELHDNMITKLSGEAMSVDGSRLGSMVIEVFTHPNFTQDAARATFVRRSQP